MKWVEKKGGGVIESGGELLQLLQSRLRRDSSLGEGAFWYKYRLRSFNVFAE